MQFINDENIHMPRKTAVSIGKFDGLHLGHMSLIKETKKIAKNRGLATVILSFSPHPSVFLSGRPMPLILTTEEKIHLLDNLGIDYYIEYPFTQKFAQTNPEDFIKNILISQLRCNALVVGQNFRYGKNGEGDVALAQKLGNQFEFTLHVKSHVEHNGEKVSSENIRPLVTQQDFAKFAALAGRNFFLLGRPDNNGDIFPNSGKTLPPPGIYAVVAHLDGFAYPTTATIYSLNQKTKPPLATNRPSNFASGEPELSLASTTSSKIHLDVSSDLLEKTLRIDFHKHIGR